MNKPARNLILLAGLLTGVLLLAANANAANQPLPKGITVTPAFQQVSIDSGTSQQPINFSVTNNEPSSQTLSLTAADFNTLNESGGLFFVGTNPTDLQKKYGLAKWLSLPQPQITLAPKQTQTIKAEILNLPDMPAGGHYGALMFAVAQANPNHSGNNVALHPVASSLLFVTKLGGDTHKLGLQKVSLSHSLFGLPGSVNLRFHNDGNTHVIPRGVASLIDPHGRVVSKGIINDDSGIILPQTFRQYHVPLQKVVASNLPGRYKVKIDFRFDGISQFRTYQQTFTYLPVGSMVIIIIAIAGLVIAIRYFLGSHSRKG
jgi:hypothetical protein